MSLSRHIKSQDLIDHAQSHKHHHGFKPTHHASSYGGRYSSDTEIPKFEMPQKGCPDKQAYQIIHDETALDGNPSLNLASFVHTWLPDEAKNLMVENMNKNLADQDEYPSMIQIHNRCVSMISDLWNVPKDCKAIGTATTGSSEAILLGGLAMKKRWQAKMKAAGKSIHEPGPNIIMGAEAHCSLEKFSRYFDVESRSIPISVDSKYVMDPKEAIKQVDENTIGVYIILGSTYTGHFENVKEMSDLLDDLQKRTGIDVPIHVDAASGGFVAPFVYPDYEWDFRIPRVHSINASGHKFGMTAVGCGWAVWKDEKYLPKELIMEMHYLGSTEYSFTLNFSRPGAPIIGQYFLFLSLGREGYKSVMETDLKNARMLSNALEMSGYYTVLSDIHRKAEQPGLIEQATKAVGGKSFDDEGDDALAYIKGLPVVSFRFSDEFQKQYPDVQQSWMQQMLRLSGWIVPNYALAPGLDKIEILRVVVRENITMDMIERLLEDIVTCTEKLIDEEGPFVSQAKSSRTAEKGSSGEKKTSRSKGGSIERALGSLDLDDGGSKHQGYSRQC